jgi:large subunit ribosomal protein L4
MATVTKKTTSTPVSKPKAAKKVVASTVKADDAHVASTKATGLVVHMMGNDGAKAGSVTLPKELFGDKVNKAILAQAVRVFLANQREGSAKAKTRGEVEGSTRKIYKQKGTGRARHGSIRAPIFVGGGVVFGPTPRDYHLNFTKGMKRVALASALSQRHNENGVVIAADLESVEPKTKAVARAFAAMGIKGKVLLAVSKDAAQLVRAAKNMANVDIMRATDLNPYMILMRPTLLMTKQGLEEAKAQYTK